jgi:hypothetical protein
MRIPILASKQRPPWNSNHMLLAAMLPKSIAINQEQFKSQRKLSTYERAVEANMVTKWSNRETSDGITMQTKTGARGSGEDFGCWPASANCSTCAEYLAFCWRRTDDTLRRSQSVNSLQQHNSISSTNKRLGFFD